LAIRAQVVDGKIDVVGRDVLSFKTEVATVFGTIRGEIASLRTDMIEKLGNLKIWVLLSAGEPDGPMICASLRPFLRKLEYRELNRCGHSPWLERFARSAFFSTLKTWLSARTAARG
jgi:hypothetical protein